MLGARRDAMKRNAIFLVCAALLLGGAGASQAQSTNASAWTSTALGSIQLNNSAAAFSPSRIQRQIFNSSVPQYRGISPTNYSNLFSSSLVSGRRQKPFSNLSNPVSVTPYLALSDPFTSSAHSYYTQVRPQLEQQRINDQMARRSVQMQQQLTSLAAQPPYNPQGNPNLTPTGHAAVYMNYGGYYPSGGPQRR
jgi:hypothetical protein